MDCINHPGVSATKVCLGCAESFCENCIVEISGHDYCGSCKVMALKSQPDLEVAGAPCEEADEALRYAILGIFCLGPILEPIALFRARKARSRLAADPTLAGSGKATAATIIAGSIIAIWAIYLIVIVVTSASR
jgi:hypothetical protein